MKYGFLWAMLEMLTGAYNRDDRWEVEEGRPPKTHIGRLFAVFAWGLEIIKETLTTIKEWDNIDNAAGAALDRYGKNYGVKREGTTDDFYRLMIQVKMIAQVSGGDMDTVIHAAASLYDLEPEYLDVQEIYPAKCWLFISTEDMNPERKKKSVIIGKLLKRIVACGVGFDVVWRLLENMDSTFYFTSVAGTMIEEDSGVKVVESDKSEPVVYAHFFSSVSINEEGNGLPVTDLWLEDVFSHTASTSCYITEDGGGPDNV